MYHKRQTRKRTAVDDPWLLGSRQFLPPMYLLLMKMMWLETFSLVFCSFLPRQKSSEHFAKSLRTTHKRQHHRRFQTLHYAISNRQMSLVPGASADLGGIYMCSVSITGFNSLLLIVIMEEMSKLNIEKVWYVTQINAAWVSSLGSSCASIQTGLSHSWHPDIQSAWQGHASIHAASFLLPRLRISKLIRTITINNGPLSIRAWHNSTCRRHH